MLQIIKQRERRRERIATESFGIQCLIKGFARCLKIDRLQTLPVCAHPIWRSAKRCRRGEALDFSGCLEFPQTRGNFLPVIVQFLRIHGANNREDWFPAHRHLVHDFLESAAGANILWLQRTCAGLKMERGNRRKANHSQQQQERRRQNQHGRRFPHDPAHIVSHDFE